MLHVSDENTQSLRSSIFSFPNKALKL